MTDLEISKALALAIGWPQILTTEWEIMVRNGHNRIEPWRNFDYTDWNVISPIAAKYNCFPQGAANLWYIPDHERFEVDTTPQKAIAMCVINGVKK